jgi:hypothetical protein
MHALRGLGSRALGGLARRLAHQALRLRWVAVGPSPRLRLGERAGWAARTGCAEADVGGQRRRLGRGEQAWKDERRGHHADSDRPDSKRRVAAQAFASHAHLKPASTPRAP